MYRSFLLFCIFITGGVSLVYQMIWQRYLAILVGSDAKSAALVVAIFLLGLACGYAFFGNLTEKNIFSSRRGLLKFYGWVECLTAIYVIIFPHYFVLLQKISFNGPFSLIFDIFIVVLALFFPTVLMGATIPLMTVLFPSSQDKERNREIDSFHAKIYGFNTLGAFLGTLLGGYVLIPLMGLSLTLMMMGLLNFVVGVVYIFNFLKGPLIPQSGVYKQKTSFLGNPLQHIETKNLNFLFYALVFVIGALTIGLEILLIRIVSLTIGSNVYVFPTVLGVVILGIGFGSLNVVKQVQKFFNQQAPKSVYKNFILAGLFLAGCCLIFFFWSVPYLPTFINHIRVSLITIASNQFVYLFFTFLALSIVLVPAFYLLGGILPYAYCCIDKDQKNYGRVCGFLYFFNTVGSLVGAIFLGYLSLHFFSIETIFRFCLFVLFLMGFLLSFQYLRSALDQKTSHLRFVVFCTLFTIGLSFVMFIPSWDRRHHYMGLFRNQELAENHFKTWFMPEAYSGHPLFIEDGPNSTVAVLKEEPYMPEQNSYQSPFSFLIPGPGYQVLSIIVNGKSDGNSWGDFPTVYSAALLPYIHAPTQSQLKSLVIGFGTGITSGSLGRFEDISTVETIEISSVIVKKHAIFDPVNFHVSQNPKVSVIRNDAFKFLTHSQNMYDVIVSEPSNPWVVGVENLFSLEFYEFVKHRLNKKGVFAQWFHTYSMNIDLFKMVYDNLSLVFPYIISYRMGNDVIILAKTAPYTDLGQPSPVMAHRFSENFVTKANAAIGINHLLNLKAMEITNAFTSLHLGFMNGLGYHTLVTPKLTFGASRAFFLDEDVSFYDVINYHPIARHFYNDRPKSDALLRLMEEGGTACGQMAVIDQLCSWFNTLRTLYTTYQGDISRESLVAYSTLRRLGFLSPDADYFESITGKMLEDFDYNLHSLLIKEMYIEGFFVQARTYLDRLKSQHLITRPEVLTQDISVKPFETMISENFPKILESLKKHQDSLTL